MSDPRVEAVGGRGWRGAVVVVVAVAAGLRLAGIFDDFWFDEIWSWRIARSAGSVVNILTAPFAQSDNNHPLNTFVLYVLGDRNYWPIYRIPSVVAGVVTVALAVWYVVRTIGREHAIVTGILLGLSYPLVVYSSEARGYALMVMFAVAAFVSLDGYFRRPSWVMAAGFGLWCVLGFLSHLTFAHFYLAAVVWTLGRTRRLADLVKLHLAPFLFAGFLYLVFARYVTIGGAPDASVLDVIYATLSLMAGGPERGAGRAVPAVVAAGLVLCCLVLVHRHRRRFFWFFLTCTVLSPALFVVAQSVGMRGNQTLFPRYFLVSITFAYLVVGMVLGDLLGTRGRPLVWIVLVGYCAGSVYQTAMFLRGTRGHYAAAVERMVAEGGGRPVIVAGDDPFRTRMLLSFYARRLPAGAVSYAREGQLPDYFVVNTPQAGVAAPGRIRFEDHAYDFDREFTYRGLSGWSWYVYRRAE